MKTKTIKPIITSAVIAAVFSLVSCAPTAADPSVTKYTSNKCVVTGDPIDVMGTPITKVYGKQELKFCCAECVTTYEKNPERFASNIRLSP